MQDNSDRQYRSFRNNIPALTVLALSFLVLRFLVDYTRSRRPPNYLHLVPFLAAFSILMLSVLHGTSILKIAVIMTLNYTIAKTCGGSKVGPVVTWVFNGFVLFANEWNDGYEFARLHPTLETLVSWDEIKTPELFNHARRIMSKECTRGGILASTLPC